MAVSELGVRIIRRLAPMLPIQAKQRRKGREFKKKEPLRPPFPTSPGPRRSRRNQREGLEAKMGDDSGKAGGLCTTWICLEQISPDVLRLACLLAENYLPRKVYGRRRTGNFCMKVSTYPGKA